MLSAIGISKSYYSGGISVPVLADVDFTVTRGKSTALTGESGSGKTTLLHILAGLDLPDSGSVMLDGETLSEKGDAERAMIRRRKIGLVFQDFNLLTPLTTAANIAFQAKLAGNYDKAWADHLAERLGLADKLGRLPAALSGGEQQRVAIARTFAAKPDYVLADEPTGNLDDETSARVMAMAEELVGETDCGFLMVTHSRRLAERLDEHWRIAGGHISKVSECAA